MDNIIYRPAKENEWESAMLLAWITFLRYDAPDYTEEGIDSFRNFVIDDNLKLMFLRGAYKLFLAEDTDTGRIVGMISLRDISHISLLFVDEDHHCTGIGRNLIEYAREKVKKGIKQMRITVNAAPYAVDFYHKVGFIDTGLAVTQNGITYTPMELLL